MSKALQILMPLAGAGSRFAKAGFATPKPLIEVDGRPMFLKAISSLDNVKAEKRYIFVIRQEHVDTQQLDTLIKAAQPEAKIVVLPEITRGAAETALAAQHLLNPEDGLVVMDCDLWFNSHSYDEMIQASLNNSSNIAGGLLTFKADDPRYSYAEVGPDGFVIRTAEKKVISEKAITGAYFFATAKEFIDSGESLLQQPLNAGMPEYYLSLLYNILLDEGKNIQAAYVDKFASFGTPEELETYKKTTT